MRTRHLPYEELRIGEDDEGYWPRDRIAMMKTKQLAIFGDHDDNTLKQIEEVASHPKAVAAALMADGHLGYGMPIGGVVAYDNAVSPEGVGYDIACGNKAVRTRLHVSEIEKDLPEIMDRIFHSIPFGIGKANGEFGDHELFDRPEFRSFVKAVSLDDDLKGLMDTAKLQLGSVGSGNHYVDILKDSHGMVWIGVHFGSRGFGWKLAKHYMDILDDGKKWKGDPFMKPCNVEPLSSALGDEYWEAMKLAGQYAYAGRDCVVWKVLEILGTTADFNVHNHHNFAWKEEHHGQEVVVVRKGATPAFPGQEGFVGGSMGDDAVVLEGYPSPEYPNVRERQAKALFSTVHGAGRVMSRGQAKKKITKEEWREWVDNKGVIVRGADVDEAPQAYRRLNTVLIDQQGTIKTLHTLKPIGVAMAGPKDKDPYKD